MEYEDEMVEAKLLIQRKDEYIAGLQRNCETLSSLCAKHMQQVSLLKSDLDRMSLEKHQLESESQRYISNEVMTVKLTKENHDLLESKKSLTTKVDHLQTKLYTFQQQISELTDQKEDLNTDLFKEKTAAFGLRQELEEMKNIINNSSTNSNSDVHSHANKNGDEFFPLLFFSPLPLFSPFLCISLDNRENNKRCTHHAILSIMMFDDFDIHYSQYLLRILS